MGPAGVERHAQQGRVAKPPLHPPGEAGPPRRAHPGGEAPGVAGVPAVGGVELLVVRRSPRHQRQVLLLHLPLLEGPAQRLQRQVGPRQHQAAAGLGVEPVWQAGQVPARHVEAAQAAHRGDHRHAARLERLHRQPRHLVDHQAGRVVMEDGQVGAGRVAGPTGAGRRQGHLHLLAPEELADRRAGLAADADPPLVDEPARALELEPEAGRQPAVEPSAGVCEGDGDGLLGHGPALPRRPEKRSAPGSVPGRCEGVGGWR